MSAPLIASIESLSHRVTIYLGIPILLLGTVGGSLNVLVFLSLRTFRQSSCAFYLTVMAMVGIGYMITGLLTFVMIYGFAIDWTQESRFYCIFREGCVHVFMLIAFTCLCLATIDQFLATCSSVYWQQWVNIRVAHRSCAASVLFWFLYGIAFFASYDLIVVPSTGKADCVMVNETFHKYFDTFHVLILLGALPLSITAVFGYLAHRNIQQLSYRTLPLVRRELDKQLTVMVLTQVVFNVFAIAPYFVVNAVMLNSHITEDAIGNAILACARIVSILLLYSSFAVSMNGILPNDCLARRLSRVHSTCTCLRRNDSGINSRLFSSRRTRDDGANETGWLIYKHCSSESRRDTTHGELT